LNFPEPPDNLGRLFCFEFGCQSILAARGSADQSVSIGRLENIEMS